MAGWTAQLKEFELYDEGLYVAQIIDTELTEPGQYGRQGCWKLELHGVERADNEPAYINFYTPIKISAANKYGELFRACRRPLPEPGEDFQSASLIGEFIQARVKQYTRKKDSLLGCKVSDVLPLTPKQRQAITLSMPGTQPEVEEEPRKDPGFYTDETPAAKSNAAAAANTAGEEAKAAAVGELQPLLVALAGSDIKLSKANTGPGLVALLKAAKAQEKKLPDISFSLVSMSSIEQATAEVKKLLGLDAGDDDDIFVHE